MAHSMGGPVSLYFFTKFNRVSQAWKDKYIHAYIPIAGAWNGGVASLRAVISEFPVADFIPSAVTRFFGSFLVKVARTLESIPWLIPKSSVFRNKVLVSTPSKKYTANDYKDLFEKIGYKNGYQFFERVQGLLGNYLPPNVPTYCYYGTQVPTVSMIEYAKDFDPDVSTIGVESVVKKGNGDGTVNIQSLEVCKRWKSMTKPYNFTAKQFPKAAHLTIVKDRYVLDNIARIVRAPTPRRPGRRRQRPPSRRG